MIHGICSYIQLCCIILLTMHTDSSIELGKLNKKYEDATADASCSLILTFLIIVNLYTQPRIEKMDDDSGKNGKNNNGQNLSGRK